MVVPLGAASKDVVEESLEVFVPPPPRAPPGHAGLRGPLLPLSGFLGQRLGFRGQGCIASGWAWIGRGGVHPKLSPLF